MTNLKGKNQLVKRMGAVAREVTPQGADRWQRRTTRLAKSTISGYDMPYSKGALERSIKVGAIRKTGGRVTQARVDMMFHGFFVDAGTQGHGLNSRMSRVIRRRGISGAQYKALIATSRTVFAKKARGRRGGGYAARPFRDRVAQEALKQTSFADILVDVWNGAV